MRFRRFTRRRLRRLGLVAVSLAAAMPAGAVAHDDDHGSHNDHTADLSLVLTGSPDPVQGGDTATITATIANDGPKHAKRVRVAIALTGPRDVVSAVGTGWSCEAVGPDVSCIRKRLRSEWSSQIVITTIAPRGFARIGVGAVVRSQTDDDDPVNNTATIQLGINNPPVVNADAATATGGAATEIPVLDNDSDPDGDQLTFTGATPPTSGSVTCDDDACRYTPASDFTGTATFTYTVTDGRGASGSAQVTVTVTAPAPPPPPNPPSDPPPPPPPPPAEPPPGGNTGNAAPTVAIVGPTEVSQGGIGPFRITVGNRCTVIARRVVVRITLPVGTTIVTAPSGAVQKGRTVTIPIGAVQAFRPRQVGVRVRFGATGGGVRTLVAAVTSTNARLTGDGLVIAVRRSP